MDAAAGVGLAEVDGGEAGWVGSDLLRRAFGDDLAAAIAAERAEVDDVVGVEHDVEVVLDDDDGVAAVGEALEDGEQVAHVLEARGRSWARRGCRGCGRSSAGRARSRA